MSQYRPHPAPAPLLIGYDPVRDLPPDHLARLVEYVVEESVTPKRRRVTPGQPAYDPRLCVKVLVYGYATGIRSSRQLERLCSESLPYLFLTRGEAPSYRTLCTGRHEYQQALEEVWISLLSVGESLGLKRLGRITVDSTKLRANASSESVVGETEYEAVLAELRRILEEAEVIDRQEAKDGAPGETRLKQVPQPDQMRDILRRVRRRLTARPAGREAKPAARATAPAGPGESGKEPGESTDTPAPAPGSGAPAEQAAPEAATKEEPPLITEPMQARVEEAITVLETAKEEHRKHVSLTDPEAEMMPEGREKKVRECHSFETAVDNGSLVAGGTSQAAQDNSRLLGLVAAAKENEPHGVVAVDGDSGYYTGDGLAALLGAGIDTCIPDSNTAGDLHRGLPIGTTRARGQGSVSLTYDSKADCYRCPQGNELRRVQERQHCGQRVRVYRAVHPCRTCPLAAACLTQKRAQYKMLKVGDHHALLEAARQRFADPDHRARYRQRGPAVEGIYAFTRSALGFTRWLLRGKQGVDCEGTLFKAAYQLRKVHVRWAAAA